LDKAVATIKATETW